MMERTIGKIETTGVLDPKPRRLEYRGFYNIEQQVRIESIVNSIGIPVDNIRILSYKPTKKKDGWDTLGHWNRQNGEIALYKSLEDLPEIAQLATITHELAHEASPLIEGNESLYKNGEKDMNEALFHAQAVAEQTDMTRIYLDPYHKRLHQQMLKGEISMSLFIEETHAIMIELRFKNKEHLVQVQKAQEQKLKDNFSIATRYQKPVNILDGVDRTLIALIGRDNVDVKTSEDLDNHIQKVRNGFKNALHQAA